MYVCLMYVFLVHTLYLFKQFLSRNTSTQILMIHISLKNTTIEYKYIRQYTCTVVASVFTFTQVNL